VYVIVEPGLMQARYDAGFTMYNVNPDSVVVGEGRGYSLEALEKAVKLVLGGARLIGTNQDLTGPSEGGIVPACGALVAPIELSTEVKAYFVGKPNPLMMRHGLRRLNAKREDTAIIGDRMDTDIVAGMEAEIETVLVLSGVTSLEDISCFPYRPRHILEGVFEIPE
jgi:NagD protein